MQIAGGEMSPTVVYTEVEWQENHEEIASLLTTIRNSRVVGRGKSAVVVEVPDFDLTKILIVKAGRFVVISTGEFTYVYWPRAGNVVGHSVYVRKANLVLVLWSRVNDEKKNRYEDLWRSVIDFIYPPQEDRKERKQQTPEGAITDRREIPA